MSYLHCHTKGCNWSQDDWWDWKWSLKIWKFRCFGYNPISLILDNIRYYGKPRIINTDNGKGCYSVFSWVLMFKDIRRQFSKFYYQKWWTYKAFKKDIGAVCPKCGLIDFDID